MQTIQAILFDWAGTTIDYGSRAPTRVFREIFERRGITITEEEARGPMGLAKRDHIAAIINLPRVKQIWLKNHGKDPTDADVESLYQVFLPLQKTTLADHADIIPGVIETVSICRKRGIKIGSSTGYTRELMQVVAPLAAEAGYAPDAIICSDEVTTGRPAPWMNYHAAEQLGIYPLSQVLVVDDTPVGIEAGLHAGAVTVAVTQTGNMLGLSEEAVNDLPANELETRLDSIEQQFRSIGAHHVVKSVAEIPALLEQLQR